MESLIYSQRGDYLIPNLTLPVEPGVTLGKYGQLRRAYLQGQRPILYNSLTLKGSLHGHLWEIEQTAKTRLEHLMTELAEKNPPPDRTAGQVAMLRHREGLHRQAEEILLTELIYR